MLSPELLRETLDTVNLECWERERTATPVRASPETGGFRCAHKTRASCEGRVSRRWLRLSDCPCSIRIERSTWLYRPKPDRKRFQTLNMRIDRFHSSWVGSRSSVRRWCSQFAP